ncbi:hypothetical protein, partial [Terribacillus saccharophilus]|uniref:hypothetical protein n=1 Tax=Terribacillus saccharophilus TaxID=361277 RepID=UPI001C3EE1B5
QMWCIPFTENVTLVLFTYIKRAANLKLVTYVQRSYLGPYREIQFLALKEMGGNDNPLCLLHPVS